MVLQSTDLQYEYERTISTHAGNSPEKEYEKELAQESHRKEGTDREKTR